MEEIKKDIENNDTVVCESCCLKVNVRIFYTTCDNAHWYNFYYISNNQFNNMRRTNTIFRFIDKFNWYIFTITKTI